ncbi:MAG TPA: 5'-nucleotidase [Acetivibrio sp.]|jgi:5'-nucleotidase|nr:5'-nucleotidase [Clostridium sp.]HOQ02100.1 5'-nucleotidase [Acetivibrio clariflavus]HQA57524.1 5'-nucleotidase [Acetivibrio sp.]
MPYDLSKYLVIGISSRALFDLSFENEIYEKEGLEAYCKYQIEHEDEVLKPGAGFPLVQALLKLNEKIPNKRITEVIIMSRNNADTSLRIFNSIDKYGLDIKRAALTSGVSIAPYLKAFKVDLFLSAFEDDVQEAIDANVPAAMIYSQHHDYRTDIDEIRIAFDGDAVLFSDEAEKIYQEKGLDAFIEHEKANAKKPLPEGPFAKLLRTLSYIQNEVEFEKPPIRTALVTARNSPAHERVIRTLREWNVRIDEAFFLGGISKAEILNAFGAHIFFDDQDVHCSPASNYVPAAKVPYKRTK